MQEQKKSNVTYWLKGKNISKEEFSSLVGEYFKYFDSGSVKAVDYSIIESLFDGEYKSQRQINDHLKDVIEKDSYNNSFIPGFGFSTKRGDTLNYQKHSSTRHKYSGEGDFHRCPNLSTEEMKKAINNLENRKIGVKESDGKLNYELDWEFIQQISKRMSQNKGKYEPYNWTKPMDVEKLKQSLFRHVIEVMKGNYSDDGREFGHLESVALNAMMINYQLKNNK